MKIGNVTFDCEDAASLAGFWAALLERDLAPDANEYMAFLPGTPNLLFLKVPEARADAKNRVHVDLNIDDIATARARAEELGATFVHEKEEYGVHWVTMLDPESNEFCMGVH
jgi:predicted enzyme related to lactoylglutathione lyase